MQIFIIFPTGNQEVNWQEESLKSFYLKNFLKLFQIITMSVAYNII